MKGLFVFASLVIVGMAGTASAQLFGLRNVDPNNGIPGQVVRVDESTGAASTVVPVDNPLNWILDGDIAFRGQDAYITSVWTGGPGLSFGKVDLTTGHFTFLNDEGGDLNWFGLAYVPTTDLFYTVDIVESRFLSITPDGQTITDIAFNDWTPVGLTYVDSDDLIYAINGFDLITLDYHTGDIGIIGQIDPMIQGYPAEIAYDPLSDTLYMNLEEHLYTLDRTNADATLIGPNGFAGVTGLGFRTVPEPGTLAALGWGALALIRKRKRRA